MTCKDCIHEKVCDALIKSGCPYLDEEVPADAFCMEFRNTADVVPKSEVEELIKSVDDMLDLVCAMTGLELTYYGKYAELKKKYTEGEQRND